MHKLQAIVVALVVLTAGYAFAQGPTEVATSAASASLVQYAQVAGMSGAVPSTEGSNPLSHYGWWKPGGHQSLGAADEQARAEQGAFAAPHGVQLPGLYAAPGQEDAALLGGGDYRFAWGTHLATPAPAQSLAAPHDDGSLKAGPFTARLLTHRGSEPGAVLPSALSGRVTPDVEGYDPQREEMLQQGGYLALEWRSGAMGLTIGGGLSRTHVATASGGASEERLLRYSLDRGPSSSRSSSSGFDSSHRVAAFVAMPYQITDRFGLMPEFSYYHGQSDAGPESGDNEWVMGLQFRFGF